MPREGDDTKEVERARRRLNFLMGVLLPAILFVAFIFLAVLLVSSKSKAETLPKTFFAWNCGEQGEVVCVTNDTKKVPGVFGVAKFHPDTLRPLVYSDSPKYRPYYYRGAYLPTVIIPKREKLTFRRERRQIGDINKPVYVVYDEEGNEVAVSESGGRPLYIEPGRDR